MTKDSWSPAIERMLARVQDTMASVKEGFPHWADPETGQWTTTPDGDWTGGYWNGMLWLAAATTGDARYRAGAAPLAERLRVKITAETVFKSFPAYYGAALGAILHDAPGPREIAIETTRNLAWRLYSPALKLIPLGAQAEEGAHIGNTETSIDSLQAATLLFWAARATGDAKLREVAASHAETVIHLHLGPMDRSSSRVPSTRPRGASARPRRRGVGLSLPGEDQSASPAPSREAAGRGPPDRLEGAGATVLPVSLI